MKGVKEKILTFIIFFYTTQFSFGQPTEDVLNNLLKSIPSPLEASALIKKEGLKYDKSLLNPLNKEYTSPGKQALNLGIYSTDLGYLNIYEQKDSLLLGYLTKILELSEKLAFKELIDFGKIAQYSMLNDMNGLLSETSASFEKISQTLIEKEKPELSVLMLSGGWLETLYLTCQLAKKSPNKVLDEKIAEQKIVLGQLLNVVKNYEKGEEMKLLREDLEKLNTLFKKIKIKQKARAADESYQITTWGIWDVVVYDNKDDKGKILYKQEDLNNILTLSATIRENIVN